ncbi:MAG: MFS transporter [Alphaproteobacteria bacterium]
MTASTPSESAGARAWLVVAVGFAALAVSFTARALLGLTMTAWEDAFGWSRAFVSSAGAIALVVMAVVAPLAGALADRFGARPVMLTGLAALAGAGLLARAAEAPWQLMLALGLLGGIGYGFVAQHVVAAIVAAWFTARRGLATGLALAGSTAGQLLLIPVMAWLLATIAWGAPFGAVAILALGLMPAVWFATRRRALGQHHANAHEGLRERLGRLASSQAFRALFASFTLCGFTTTGVVETHLFPYAALCGFVPLESAQAYSVLAGFNLIGMILAGWLVDRVHRPSLLGAIFFLRALSFLVLMDIAGSLPALYVFAAMFGLLNFSVFPVIAGIVASRLGVGVMGLALGVLFTGHSLGAAVGMLAAGVLYDLYARYVWVWIIAFALAALAGAIALTIRDPGPSPAPTLATA